MAPSTDPDNPWLSWTYIERNSDALMDALTEHLWLTVSAVAIATLIAIPLAILAYRVGWLAGPILGTSGVLYTIPSLALFAFLAPFTGLHPRTVLIGLVLYALLILVRSTLVGLTQVPDEVRDAARGMGYGSAAMLWRIELRLALPSIISGIRVATVSTVALTTVGNVAGHGGLGDLMVAGFTNNFYRAQILTATLLCVALALVLDALIAIGGRAAMPWTKGRRAA